MPNGDAHEWETNWRKGVNTKLDELAAAIQGMIAQIVTMQQTIRDMRRAPEATRNWLGFAVAVAVAVFTLGCMCCSGGSVAVAIWAILSRP